MSMIAKESNGSSIPKLEDGVYTAISSMLIDLGEQNNEKFGKIQRKFMVIWTILGEEIEINGEQLPRTISKEYGYTLGDKSNLKKDLQAWRGKQFTDEELQGFDLINILNKPCQLQIIQQEKNGNTYNNISAIMSLPKGSSVDLLKDTCTFDFENEETWENYKKIPSWIQEKIKKATNYAECGLDKYVEQIENTSNDEDLQTYEGDDLPF